MSSTNTFVSLTDEQISAEKWRLTAEREYENGTGAEILVVDGIKEFARAIESVATAPLLESLSEKDKQIKELEAERDQWKDDAISQESK